MFFLRCLELLIASFQSINRKIMRCSAFESTPFCIDNYVHINRGKTQLTIEFFFKAFKNHCNHKQYISRTIEI